VKAYLDESRTRFFRHRVWNIGLVREPIHAFLEPNTHRRVEWFPPPVSGTYLADPFGVEVGGTLHILCEEFDYRVGRGAICHLERSESGETSPPRRVLESPFHMSYPFLFEHRGGVYCVPETARGREVAVFQALERPGRWRKVATLLGGIAAIDNTVFEHGGLWWLMCTDATRGPDSHLMIWHSNSPFGPWQPHHLNPVKTDLRSSRPGGTPFVHRGALYRPAQDCSRTYGARIVINRIVALSPREFEEESVAWVEPDRKGSYPDGLHTLSAVGPFTLVDGFRFDIVGRPFLNAARQEPSRVKATLVRIIHG